MDLLIALERARSEPRLRGQPLRILLSAGIYAIDTSDENSTLILDERLGVSSLVIEGLEGTAAKLVATPTAETTSGTSRRRRQLTSEALGHTYPIVRVTAQVRIDLVGLSIEGAKDAFAMQVASADDSPQLELQHCNFTGNRGAGALWVSSGNVRISTTTFVHNARLDGDGEGGGLRITGGSTGLSGCSFEANHARRGSGIAVSGNLTQVRIEATSFLDNNASERGALYLADGAVLMGNYTRFAGNVALSGGATVSRLAGFLVYVLPAPLAHWLASPFECKVFPLLPPEKQPCDLVSFPELTGRTITALPLGDIDDDYPYLCPSGIFASIDTVRVQSTPQCQGLCPGGSRCGRATVDPVPCTSGTFCPRGSSVSTPCPSGRYSNSTGLAAAEDCAACPPGSACPVGSVAPAPCRPGNYAERELSGICDPCSAGTYQGVVGATICFDCPPAHYCPEGSAVPLKVAKGKYSNVTRLATDVNSPICPKGHFCVEGSRAPEPCAAGTFGAVEGLTDFQCSGSCTEGHICPAASTNGTAVPCPAGTFNPVRRGADLSSCRPCPVGRYCPPASEQAIPCGPSLTTRVEQPAGSFLDCVCEEALYDERLPEVNQHNTSIACATCPQGTDCESPGATLESLILVPGYWRVSGSSSLIKPCQPTDVCIGSNTPNRTQPATAALPSNVTHPGGIDLVSAGGNVSSRWDISSVVCRDGHTGPYCAVCAEGYYVELGYCTKCEGNSDGSFMLSGIIAATGLVTLICCGCCKERINLFLDRTGVVKLVQRLIENADAGADLEGMLGEDVFDAAMELNEEDAEEEEAEEEEAEEEAEKADASGIGQVREAGARSDDEQAVVTKEIEPHADGAPQDKADEAGDARDGDGMVGPFATANEDHMGEDANIAVASESRDARTVVGGAAPPPVSTVPLESAAPVLLPVVPPLPLPVKPVVRQRSSVLPQAAPLPAPKSQAAPAKQPGGEIPTLDNQPVSSIPARAKRTTVSLAVSSVAAKPASEQEESRDSMACLGGLHASKASRQVDSAGASTANSPSKREKLRDSVACLGSLHASEASEEVGSAAVSTATSAGKHVDGLDGRSATRRRGDAVVSKGREALKSAKVVRAVTKAPARAMASLKARVSRLREARKRRTGTLGNKIKILVSFYQLLGSLGGVFSFTYPNFFVGMMAWMDFLNLNLFELVPVGCLARTNFFTNLLVRTLTPLFVMVTLVMLSRYYDRKSARIMATARTRVMQDVELITRYREGLGNVIRQNDEFLEWYVNVENGFKMKVKELVSNPGLIAKPSYHEDERMLRLIDALLTPFTLRKGKTDEVQASYARFDSDGNGEMDVDELHAALKSLGLVASMVQTRSIMRRYDKDGSNSLDLDEYRWLVAEMRAMQKGRVQQGGSRYSTGRALEVRSFAATLLQLTFITLFLVYPGCSSVIFQTFICEPLDDGSRFLKKDLSIDCDSAMYSLFFFYACGMLFIYPLGTPAFYVFLIFKNRHRLRDLKRYELRRQNLHRLRKLVRSATLSTSEQVYDDEGRVIDEHRLKQIKDEYDQQETYRDWRQQAADEMKTVMPAYMNKVVGQYNLRTCATAVPAG